MSWTVIKELKENRAKAFADAQSVTATAHKENRDLTADEETRHAKLLADVDSFGKRIEREEKTAAMGEKLGSDSRSHIGREDTSTGMPARDMRKYSIVRALQKRINNQPLDGLEAEVSQEIGIRTGKPATGFYVPMETFTSRALDTSAGTGAVGVNLMPDLIDLLRNKLVLNQLGATVMANMVGKFSLPRQSGGATGYWVGESGSPTGSAQTLDQVAFVPKTVGAYTDISRQFINQSSIDAETFVRNDLAAVLARAIDLAGYAGTGSSNQPTGIINTSGINAISHGTNGGAETWTSIVSYEKAVLAANVDPASKLGYLSNSKVAAALKTADKTTGGYGQFILGLDGKVNNYPFAISNAVTSAGTKGSGTGLSTVVFGNFADLVIALFGGLDITVDPFTGSSSGTIRIVALQDCDVEVRHPLSFAVATDVIA